VYTIDDLEINDIIIFPSDASFNVVDIAFVTHVTYDFFTIKYFACEADFGERKVYTFSRK
jgi:hypothetical protein